MKHQWVDITLEEKFHNLQAKHAAYQETFQDGLEKLIPCERDLNSRGSSKAHIDRNETKMMSYLR